MYCSLWKLCSMSVESHQYVMFKLFKCYEVDHSLINQRSLFFLKVLSLVVDDVLKHYNLRAEEKFMFQYQYLW